MALVGLSCCFLWPEMSWSNLTEGFSFCAPEVLWPDWLDAFQWCTGYSDPEEYASYATGAIYKYADDVVITKMILSKQFPWLNNNALNAKPHVSTFDQEEIGITFSTALRQLKVCLWKLPPKMMMTMYVVDGFITSESELFIIHSR